MNTRKNITRRVMSLHLALFIILPVCTFQGGLQVSAASVSGTIAKSYFVVRKNGHEKTPIFKKNRCFFSVLSLNDKVQFMKRGQKIWQKSNGLY